MALRTKFASLFASASLGLIVAGCAYVALASLRDGQLWVTHTYDVIDALRAQEFDVVEAESAQRGLILGENELDRASYSRASAAALESCDELKRLTVDNASQQDRIARLKEAAVRRLQVLDDVLHAKGTGVGDGRRAMASMRAIAGDIEASERALLTERTARVQTQTIITRAILIGGSLLAFVLSLFVMNDVKRDVDSRERLRLLLEQQTEQLAEQAVFLEASKNTAEAANRTKSMFLANMSHELRTPLNAVLGYSEMLQEEAEDKGLSQFLPDLKSIHAAGKHLLGLINDVLDLSKIEAGKMDLFLEDFEVGAMLQDVEHTIRPLVVEKGNQLVVERAAATRIHADLTKTRQTLFNVLSNAAKFTKNGLIRLSVSGMTKDGKDFVVMRVTDTGVGMNEEQLGRLFEPFMQADASTTRKFGGTGLGLAISRRFCEMMGGTITAESQPGKGSTFTITLPTKVEIKEEAAASATTARTVAPLGARPRVLVIDDDHDTRDLMDRHLTKEGFSVITASNGADGLRLARETHPIAITLDVMMPTTDGWSVLTELKADPILREIPVIMLTMVSDRGLAYRLGASEFMTKPIDRARLAEVLSRYRPLGNAGKALVVEDDKETRRLTREMLERDGWNVTEAEDGAAALRELNDSRPDVVILDLMMPTMDGFELAATVHAHDAWKTIPIVVLTAKDITNEDRMRLAGYVEKIIQKGAYDRRRLLDEVRDIVANHARTRGAIAREMT